MIAITLATSLKENTAASVRTFAAFTAPANSTLVAMFIIGDGAAMSGGNPVVSGGGLTWTGVGSTTNGVHSAHVFTAQVGVADASVAVSVNQGTLLNGFVGAVMIARSQYGAVTVRQRRALSVIGGAPTFAFTSTVDSGNALIVGFGVGRNPAACAPPAGWTELFDDGVAKPIGLEVAYLTSGGSGASFAFGGSAGDLVGLGVELVTPSCACTLADPNYTAGTFDLWMAPISDLGVVGADELIGNIATGTYADDAEAVDCFDPLANLEEPIAINIRMAERLQFVADEVTCENLERFLNLEGVNAAGGTTMGVDAVVRPPMYRVTLEHTMPCGHIITRRIHRAAVVSRASWLFSPGAWHGLPFELRAYPDDRQTNVYGYWTITPGTCGAAS